MWSCCRTRDVTRHWSDVTGSRVHDVTCVLWCDVIYQVFFFTLEQLQLPLNQFLVQSPMCTDCGKSEMAKHRTFIRHVYTKCSLFVLSHKNTQNMSLLVPSVDYSPLKTTSQFSVLNFFHLVANWEAGVSTAGHGESWQRHRLSWPGDSCGSPVVTAVFLSGHCDLPFHHSSLILSSTHHSLTHWQSRIMNKNI